MLPKAELRVEEDFAVGTVRLESVEESEVRKLAFDRLRSSLKKVMAADQGNRGSCVIDRSLRPGWDAGG